MKKILSFAAVFCVVLAASFFACTPVVSASGNMGNDMPKKAEQVTFKVSCDALPGARFSNLMDNYFQSYFEPKEDVRLNFSMTDPVSGIYCVFELPCQWTLTLPDGTVKQGGEYGAVHEYTAFDTPVTGFDIDFPQGCRITEIYAFTDGKLPDWVQEWEPPCERADLMVMSTHADDEFLWFGGAIPYYAGELGYKVQIVYLTNHSGETYRNHELLNGLWMAGVRNYPIITDKFKDTILTRESEEVAAQIFGRDNVREFQVEMLRRFQPKVILGQAINGEYGHGAHILNVTTLLDALNLYEDPSVFPDSAQKYGIKKVQKCYLHLWPENQINVVWSEKKLEKFGGKNAFQMAVACYECHLSQLKWYNEVREWGKCDCRKFGLVYTNVGYDTPGVNDMFEHVDWTEETPDEAQVEEETENTQVVSATDAAVSASDSVFSVFGKEISKPDICFALIAVLLSLISIIYVIWMERRE